MISKSQIGTFKQLSLFSQGVLCKELCTPLPEYHRWFPYWDRCREFFKEQPDICKSGKWYHSKDGLCTGLKIRG